MTHSTPYTAAGVRLGMGTPCRLVLGCSHAPPALRIQRTCGRLCGGTGVRKRVVWHGVGSATCWTNVYRAWC